MEEIIRYFLYLFFAIDYCKIAMKDDDENKFLMEISQWIR